MFLQSSTDRQSKQSDQLEQKFDQLLKKKHDLETRINRIPTRGLTSTDRQLYDVLEREIERVEQQISSVKLELRKLNVLRTPHQILYIPILYHSFSVPNSRSDLK